MPTASILAMGMDDALTYHHNLPVVLGLKAFKYPLIAA